MKSDREILEEAFGVYASEMDRRVVHSVRRLVNYLSGKDVVWKDFVLIPYMLHLLTLKNQSGFCHKPSWVVREVLNLKAFSSWLFYRGFFTSNPLAVFQQEEMEIRIRAVYKNRMKSLYERHGHWKDGSSFIGEYLSYAKGFLSDAYFRKLKKGLLDFDAYARSRGLGWRRMSDFYLRDFVYDYFSSELFPSVPLTERSALIRVYGVKNFFQYLFENGYLKKDFSCLWTKSFLNKLVEEEKEKKDQEKKVRKRRYSSREVLKSYQAYLKKTYKGYVDFVFYLNSFKFFLRFVSGINKSLYQVNKEVIDIYKSHLLKYEYAPGEFYSPYFQMKRLRGVKRFLDWFVNQGFVEKNPLKGFPFKAYKKELEKICVVPVLKRSILESVPEAFRVLAQSVEEHERKLGLAEGTVNGHKRGWIVFFEFLERAGVDDVREVDERFLEDYERYVDHLKNKKGEPLSKNSKLAYLISVKSIFKYLRRFRYLERDPSLCITLPKPDAGLSTSGLTHKEVMKILNAKKIRRPLDIRDRSILETLYSTGVRSNELRHVQVSDVKFDAGLVRVNMPKGGYNYQRVIPIGETALSWIRRYLKEVRPSHSKSPYLYLNIKGEQLSRSRILHIVKSYVHLTGIRKNVVTHSMRVSCGTEMLKNSADLKFVQMQLGHRSIETTEKYMRLVPSDLKKIHRSCHPMEKRKRGIS